MKPRELTLKLLILLLVAFGDSDLASDRLALLVFRASVGGRPLLLWNLSDSTPCNWTGVTCGQNAVSELRLPGMALSGHLPLGLGSLTQLQTLSLRFNRLSGPLPADFANLTALRNLYLQNNLFSGEIPSFLFTLQNLVRLDLSNNQFTGGISPAFNNLTRLATLYLQNNQLNGSIPNLNLPLEQFNVSFNHLNGSIPLKLATMPASAFAGNSLCGGPLQSCNGTSGGGDTGKKKLSGGAIAGIVMACVVGVSLIALILVFLCLRKRSKEPSSKTPLPPPKHSTEVEIPRENRAESTDTTSTDHSSAVKGKVKSGGNKNLVFFRNVPKDFDLEELLRASAEVLGKGTFGTAYKATLETGSSVAVKRLKDVTVSEKEFRSKIEEVGRMNHENLVPLRAYYYGRDEKLLVYDYMPMGSLSALLHGSKEAGRTPLNWEARSGIALGAARGIAYLHSQSPTTSHGNIKSSNILLNRSYGACVSDFGLAQIASASSTPTRVAGYRAPEVTDSRKVSQKADVYSFGVLLLELLTGKAPTYSMMNEEGVDLPRWVQSVVQEEWSAEVFDAELLRYQSVEEEMVQLLHLALQCTASYPDNRPSLPEIMSRLEELCRSALQKQGDTDSSPANAGDNNQSSSASPT